MRATAAPSKVTSSVSVVIPHAGELAYLQACLESVSAESSVAEIILVMPHGLTGSLQVGKSTPKVRCLITPDLQGYGAASNQGAAEASGSFLLVLNDDTWVNPGAVDVLAEFLSAHPEVAACGPPLRYPDGRDQPSIFRDLGLRSAIESCLAPALKGPLRYARRHPVQRFPRDARRVDWLSGAVLMVRKAAFEAVGGFDPVLAHGLEDADLCRRFRRNGHDVVAVPAPPVVHVMGASGYGSPDPERAKATLVAGLAGWCHYSRRYHGRVRRRLQQASLLMFVSSRLAYLGIRSWLGRAQFREERAAYRAAGRQVLHDAW